MREEFCIPNRKQSSYSDLTLLRAVGEVVVASRHVVKDSELLHLHDATIEVGGTDSVQVLARTIILFAIVVVLVSKDSFFESKGEAAVLLVLVLAHNTIVLIEMGLKMR